MSAGKCSEAGGVPALDALSHLLEERISASNRPVQKQVRLLLFSA